MLGFYAAERATDVDMDADADMILFQWGTVYFRPDEENARVREGNRWLERPADFGEFASWIAGFPATAYCAGRQPLRTGLDWEEAG
jgi:hypothetical protein